MMKKTKNLGFAIRMSKKNCEIEKDLQLEYFRKEIVSECISKILDFKKIK